MEEEHGRGPHYLNECKMKDINSWSITTIVFEGLVLEG